MCGSSYKVIAYWFIFFSIFEKQWASRTLFKYSIPSLISEKKCLEGGNVYINDENSSMIIFKVVIN